MKILFDTNILIRITDVRTALPPEYADVLRLASQLHHEICYHPAQLDDFERDSDVIRRGINISRIEQYHRLDSPPLPTAADIREFGWLEHSANDAVDNQLLFAVFQGVASILVTEDKQIHRKALRAGIPDLVCTIADAYRLLSNAQQRREYVSTDYVQIQDLPVKVVDIRNPILVSLRLAYNGFDAWYRKCVEQERHCWVVYGVNKEIKGLCIYNEEINPDISGEGKLLAGKILKLCTFKIAGRGIKLGERLLDNAFHYAANNKYDAMYMQVHCGKHQELIDLITSFGFHAQAHYNGDSISYVKDMTPGRELHASRDANANFAYAQDHFPYFFGGECVRKFLVPIKSTYHNLLFPETHSQDMLFTMHGDTFSSETNAIKKAYICNSKITLMRPGDLLFFYHSEKYHEVECVGIVENATRVYDADVVLKMIARRTVYRDDTVRQIVGRGGALVILFRLAHYFNNPIGVSELEHAGVRGPYQTIRTIPHAVFTTLFLPRLPYAVL